MKVFEKIGWLVFLVSLMVFVITLIYWPLKLLALFIWRSMVDLNNNLEYLLIGSLVAAVLGFLMIRVGAADKGSDI